MAGPKRIRKSGRGADLGTDSAGRHRFEHWYVNNQVCFITARCREQFPALESEQAKAIFWDRFEYYTIQAGFEPWITSLLDNHYHTLGYIQIGTNLKKMMQGLHGSVAKLVNDVLESQSLERRPKFWRDAHGQEYFDGCIRDEKQFRRAYRYTQIQGVRHGVCMDWRTYAHTRIAGGMEEALKRALAMNAFMEDVPYKRYERGR